MPLGLGALWANFKADLARAFVLVGKDPEGEPPSRSAERFYALVFAYIRTARPLASLTHSP